MNGDRHRSSRRRHDDDERRRSRSRDRGDRDRDRDRDRRRRRDDEGNNGRDRERRFDDDDRRRDRGGDRDRDEEGGRRRRRRDSPGGGGGGGGGRGGGEIGGGPVGGRRSPTPEGTIPISKRPRKFTAWDVKAKGFENYTAEQAKLTGMFNLPGQNRPNLNIGFPPQQLPPIYVRGTEGASGPVALSTSYARQSRRLYVGNITLEANENNLQVFFNNKMKEMGFGDVGADGSEPVMQVQVNHDKSYAFVEFRTAEEASKAINFDGIVFQGVALKIRRPKDYLTATENFPLGTNLTGSNIIPGVVSTQVPDTPNKIFIGGLPSYLNDEQVMELLSSFGDLKSFNLVKEGNTGVSKGFAFCEFVDSNVTDIACQGLNGMALGDRYLVVQRAAIGANPLKHPQAMGSDILPPGLSKVAPTIIQAAAPVEVKPTRCLQMLNMVTAEELVDDEEYEEIVGDIKDECENFGRVLDCKVPRPVKNEKGKVDAKASEEVTGLGKVFVLFEAEAACTKALKAIAGRQFSGRTVICAYATDETFLNIPENN